MPTGCFFSVQTQYRCEGCRSTFRSRVDAKAHIRDARKDRNRKFVPAKCREGFDGTRR